MKHQALFSTIDKSKKLKCRLLQFLFGALSVNHITSLFSKKTIPMMKLRAVVCERFHMI